MNKSMAVLCVALSVHATGHCVFSGHNSATCGNGFFVSAFFAQDEHNALCTVGTAACLCGAPAAEIMCCSTGAVAAGLREYSFFAEPAYRFGMPKAALEWEVPHGLSAFQVTPFTIPKIFDR